MYKKTVQIVSMHYFRIYNFYNYQEIHIGVEIYVGVIKDNSLKHSATMKNQAEGLGEKWVPNGR